MGERENPTERKPTMAAWCARSRAAPRGASGAGHGVGSCAAELGEDNAAYLASDVSKLEDMQALVALAKERFGRVDVLFANAGIMPAGPMSAMDYTGWMAQVDVNVKGVLSARREDRLAALAAELGEDNAAYLASDVSKLEDMQALVALAKERFGRVDVLFANAGIMPAGPMSAMDYTGWMAQVDVNVKGVLNAMAAVLPDFTGQRRGHIIATSSVAGTTLVPYNAVYCGTKHFVRAMLSSFRTESVTEGTNIRTTVIYPGKIATELLNSAAEGPGKEAARKAYAAEAIPAGAIADAVLYAVGQPDSVDVSDIVVRPTAEV